jgi:signal transduction histidine kinase
MAATRLPRRREAWLRIAAGIAAVVLLVVSVSVGAALYRGVLLLLFVGVLVQVSAIPLALIRPWVAAPLSVAGALTIMSAAHGGTAPWPWAVTTMIAQAFVLAFVGFRATAALGIGTLIGAAVLSGILAPIVNPTRDLQAVAVDLVVFTSIAGVALAVGIVAREWRAIRGQLARERRTTEGERALRLVAEEKTRIARELHDVVAHSMSIITVQATSAPLRHPQADAQTRQEFEEIAALSRRALTEMRSLLTVLREPVARAPQPRLSGIPELVTQSQRSGLSVRLLGAEWLSDDAVDETVGLSAYRIVQEALSNVMRHTRGADVEVTVKRDGGLDLTISNRHSTGPSASTPDSVIAADPGNGLVGMRERAASVGGTLVFGPTDDGGYVVHATLPLQPEITSADG